MAQLILEDVSKTFGDGTVAVDRVSFTVEDREFMVLVGPSGCGKSTTLRLIAGLDEVTAGRIVIDGRKVNDVPPRDRDIAMVFQNYALYPHMSVRENLAFGLKMRRTPRDEVDRLVAEAAAVLGLGGLLEKRPAALSGGQRQRVALGRALVRQPKIFLFDEPLSNLDARLRVQMRAELIRLYREIEATIVYVTHDQVEAMTMGSRIAVLDSGRIQQIAGPQELYADPANAFVAGFIGSPAMNFVSGRLLADPGGIVFTAADGAWNLPVTGTEKTVPREPEGLSVRLGIRPEHLELQTADEPDPNGAAIRAEVEVIEPLGYDTFVTCRAGENLLVVRTSGMDPTAGMSVYLVPDPAGIRIFEAQTGDRLI